MTRTSDRSERQPLTIRSLTQFEFCPRLFWYMYAAGLMTVNEHVAAGTAKHARVSDSAYAARPRIEGGLTRTRSLDVVSEEWGFQGKIDVLEEDGSEVRVVEYKNGKPPKTSDGPRVWPGDAVQVCAQTIALEEMLGKVIPEAVVYYVDARKRVTVPVTSALREKTKRIVEEASRHLGLDSPPDPLPPVERKKCMGCSLVGICMPEETLLWKTQTEELDNQGPAVPRVIPSDPAGAVLYVSDYGTRVGLESEHLVVKPREAAEHKIPIGNLEQVVIGPAVSLSGQAIQALAGRGIPIVHLDGVDRVAALTLPPHSPNVQLRKAQFLRSDDTDFCLKVAKSFVTAKVRNQRALMMRTLRARQGEPGSDREEARTLRRIVDQVREAESLATLLGLEGTAARVYFSTFPELLTPAARALGFDFNGRNRRPPKDPVNALLSFAYGLLAKDCAAAAHTVGLEVGCGFFHKMGRARPAIALDLMEEFRPLIADSVVLMALNNGEIGPDDFLTYAGSTTLTPTGRKAFIQVYQRRRSQLITHPTFGYEISMARAIETQARQLAKAITGEVDQYRGLVLR